MRRRRRNEINFMELPKRKDTFYYERILSVLRVVCKLVDAVGHQAAETFKVNLLRDVLGFDCFILLDDCD
jgi:hypothetical protein